MQEGCGVVPISEQGRVLSDTNSAVERNGHS
jgi:hypothetical protein